MKRKFCLLVTVLLFCIFAACGVKERSELRIPSEEIKEKVEKAWQDKKGEGYRITWYDENTPMSWASADRYYGNYGDASVIFIMGNGDAMWEISVAGESFKWNSTFDIVVYKDSKFYSLEESYNQGILSQEDVKSIAEYHEWFGETQRPVTN